MFQSKERVADWLRKNMSLQYAAYKRFTLGQRTHKLKVRGWKTVFYMTGNKRKAGVAILLSDKTEF